MDQPKFYLALVALVGMLLVFFLFRETDKDVKVRDILRESELKIAAHKQSQEACVASIGRLRNAREALRPQVEELEERLLQQVKAVTAAGTLQNEAAAAGEALGQARVELRKGLDAYLASFQGVELATFAPTGGRVFSGVTIKEVTREAIAFSHSDGVTRLAVKDTAPDARKRLGLDVVADGTALEAKLDTALGFADKPGAPRR